MDWARQPGSAKFAHPCHGEPGPEALTGLALMHRPGSIGHFHAKSEAKRS